MRFLIGITPANTIVEGARFYPSNIGDYLRSATYNLLGDVCEHNKSLPKSFAVSELRQQQPTTKESNQIIFTSTAFFHIGLLDCNQLNAIMYALLQTPTIRLGREIFSKKSTTIIPIPSFKEQTLWGTTNRVATAVKEANHRKYITPITDYEKCCEAISANIERRFRQIQALASTNQHLKGEDPRGKVKVAIRRETLKMNSAVVKGHKVTTWSGDILIVAPKPIQYMIWTLGIGAHTTTGLGAVKILEAH